MSPSVILIIQFVTRSGDQTFCASRREFGGGGEGWGLSVCLREVNSRINDSQERPTMDNKNILNFPRYANQWTNNSLPITSKYVTKVNCNVYQRRQAKSQHGTVFTVKQNGAIDDVQKEIQVCRTPRKIRVHGLKEWRYQLKTEQCLGLVMKYPSRFLTWATENCWQWKRCTDYWFLS